MQIAHTITHSMSVFAEDEGHGGQIESMVYQHVYLLVHGAEDVGERTVFARVLGVYGALGTVVGMNPSIGGLEVTA